MKLMDHPFLATTGTWQSVGTRVDGGIVERLECCLSVKRVSRGWDIRALGPQRGGGATLPAPRYDVRLPRQRGERADWIALDPSYGRLIGQFVAVDDSISSTFVSSDGRYSGSEWMMLDGGRYLARGVVLHDGDLVCRWALSLSSACPIEMADIRCVAQGSQERFFAGNGAALGQ